jgi:hypothetical protein
VIPPQTHKRCSSCKDWLPFEDFPKHKRMHNGLSSHCRKCHNAAVQDWRERNRAALNEKRREEYREAHPLRERPCVVCGEKFTGRPDRVVCSPECRGRRNLEKRRALRAA